MVKTHGLTDLQKGEIVVKRASLLIVALAFSGAALAADVKVDIPEEGWSIRFDSPPLSKPQESKRSGEYAFKASSDRFSLSLFVTKPRGEGSSHRACYQTYWSMASRNPLIAQSTVVTSETPKFVRVQYDTFRKLQGKTIRDRNVDYYFVFRGKWVDVHIAVNDATQADEGIVASFDKSLSYGS